jgi:DNA mismatch repair protein MutL
MPTIRILPEALTNRIAAGEVVERPASVVKELVENALDAGARRILIDVEQGGFGLIRVADDGCGMGPDDARLAIERHATSKVASDEDLFRIATLGFRGEALPSIASVSRFTLLTRDAGSAAGVEVTVAGGRLERIAERGAPVGTMVTVAELFFNTPARRKFLKSAATEMAHISDAVAAIALGRPQVHFRLAHNGKAARNWPAAADPFERVVDVLGGALRPELHPVRCAAEGVAVSGWIASPRVSRRTSGAIHLYVNGRPVRDRMVQNALFTAYAERLVKGQFPIAVLFVELPCDQVDVNVHPAKAEVRFARPEAVHAAVRRAAAQTLYDIDRPDWRPAAGSPAPGAFPRVAEAPAAWRPPPGRGEAFGGGRLQAALPLPRVRFGGEPAALPGAPPARGAGPGFSGLRLIGQLHATYIVCEDADGLLMIDQHAAHERVIYEQLSRGGAGAVQPLLVPETVELGAREARAIAEMLPRLAEMGIEVEPFGGNTVVVKALPALLAARPAAELITAIAEAALAGGEPAPGEAVDRLRRVAACHGAIRAGQALAFAEMQALLGQLDACENGAHCPHGRPTFLRYDLAAIERGFRRIV